MKEIRISSKDKKSSKSRGEEEGGAERSGFQIIDAQGLESGDKSKEENSIRLLCLNFPRKGNTSLVSHAHPINHYKYKMNLISPNGEQWAPCVPEAGITSTGRM